MELVPRVARLQGKLKLGFETQESRWIHWADWALEALLLAPVLVQTWPFHVVLEVSFLLLEAPPLAAIGHWHPSPKIGQEGSDFGLMS